MGPRPGPAPRSGLRAPSGPQGAGCCRPAPRCRPRPCAALPAPPIAGCVPRSDRSCGFYGRVYERRALRGRGGRSPERPRARSPPSSCWKQVFPRPPRPSDTVSVAAAAAADRRSQARGDVRAARGGRTPSPGAAPQPRASAPRLSPAPQPRASAPRLSPAPQPRAALPARRRCCSRHCLCSGPPASAVWSGTRPSFHGAPRWAGKNHGQFPPKNQRAHQLCCLGPSVPQPLHSRISVARAEASLLRSVGLSPQEGSHLSESAAATPLPDSLLRIRGFLPSRVSCQQARAVLCREDLKEIVILPHGVSTRASAEEILWLRD
ncbi:translation initiation factor IF-2-like [Gallus gallus]|uniref:translation initiation factor IF-2-like n=1 Tax=Gallus gallus TaxID=9031 RepID=UPI001AE8BBDD|nr:translation initiation factor IF-2-like [Gallus gallus]